MSKMVSCTTGVYSIAPFSPQRWTTAARTVRKQADYDGSSPNLSMDMIDNLMGWNIVHDHKVMSEPLGQLVRFALLGLWGSWVESMVALEWV